MSVVVERGLARCPRCVAVANYTFVESGPNSLRYEVLCGRCGEVYCEVHTPVTPDFTAAVDALAIRAPGPPAPAGRWRPRVQAGFTAVRTHTARVTGRAAAWIELRHRALRR